METRPTCPDLVHLSDWAQQPEVHVFCDSGPAGDTPAYRKPEHPTLPEGVHLRADGKRYALEADLATCPACLRAAVKQATRLLEERERPSPETERLREDAEEAATKLAAFIDRHNGDGDDAANEVDDAHAMLRLALDGQEPRATPEPPTPHLAFRGGRTLPTSCTIEACPDCIASIEAERRRLAEERTG